MSEFKQQLWSLDMIPKDILIDKNKRLEQALKEIKEIAENDCYDDCGMPLDELSIILQKISEVENVENNYTLGQEVVWYSEDEYNKLKEKLEYFEKCHKDLDNYIPALINGELGYIKKNEVLKNNNVELYFRKK